MHPLPHRSLSPMPLRMVHTQAQMLFLDARGARLEAREVDGVGVHELFGDGDDVGDKAVKQVEGHAFAHHNTENLGRGASGWEGVVCRVVSLLRGKEGKCVGEGKTWGSEGKKKSVLGIIYCFALSKVLTLSCFTWP